MTLTTELQDDPQALGYATPLAAGDHQEAARLINAPRTATVGARRIPSTELLIWGGAGRIAALEDAAADTQQTAEVRSAASAALRMIQRGDTELDLGTQAIADMVELLRANGVFSDADKSELQTMSTRDISRAEELFGLGTTITHSEIAEAL